MIITPAAAALVGTLGVREPVRKRFVDTGSEDCSVVQRQQSPLKAVIRASQFNSSLGLKPRR